MKIRCAEGVVVTFGRVGGVMWSTMLVKRRAVDLCRVGSCLCSD